MTDESDNLPDEGGTETVETYSDDTPEQDWDYYDPDEDEPDSVDPVAAEGTDDEEGEPEGQPEDVDPEEAADESEDDEAPQEAATTAVAKLPDGSEMTVGELIQGYFRQSDYSRKTAEVAEQRKAALAQAERIEKVTKKLVDHIALSIPDEPDPTLAYSHPQEYSSQKARYDAAVQQFQAFLASNEEAADTLKGLTDEDRQRQIFEEGQKLNALIPDFASEKTRQASFTAVHEAARTLGFSDQEIMGAMDHRIYALAHWAKKGMDADKARVSAKAKVAKTAPTPPKKPGQGARPTNSNRDAMKALQRSGSIHDAVKVDWD